MKIPAVFTKIKSLSNFKKLLATQAVFGRSNKQCDCFQPFKFSKILITFSKFIKNVSTSGSYLKTFAIFSRQSYKLFQLKSF